VLIRLKQVFGALAQNGRLSRPQLHQITRIPNRQLKHILTVLVQHHILLYHTPDEGLPFYQVDWHCYNIVRINRVNCLAQERYGDLAGKIFAFTQQLGRSKIGDLAQAFDFSPVPKRDSAIDTPGLVNGKDGGHNAAGSGTTTVGQFHSTLRKLLKAGFLVKVGKRAHIPAADLQAEMEEIVISEQFPDRKVNGPKKQAEFKSAINTLKRKWREADDYSESRDVESKGAIKRALPPSNPAAKRLKMNGGLGHGVNHGGDDLDDELVQRLPVMCHDTAHDVSLLTILGRHGAESELCAMCLGLPYRTP
jgi:DNA-directed RNA polymerase III subunit RPC3